MSRKLNTEEFDNIYSCCLHSVIKEIVTSEYRSHSLELPLLSLISCRSCPVICGLLATKAESSNNQQIKTLIDPSYLNEIKTLSSQFSNIKELALKLSLVLEVIDENNCITEYFSSCIHQFYFKVCIKENAGKIYTLLNCKFKTYSKNPIIYGPNDVENFKNALENVRKGLKTIFEKKNLDKKQKANHNILIGQVEGNSIKLFMVKKNWVYVKPALHKLEDLEKMLYSDEYIKEPMGTKEFNMKFEFPNQQSLPDSSEFFNGHHENVFNN